MDENGYFTAYLYPVTAEAAVRGILAAHPDAPHHAIAKHRRGIYLLVNIARPSEEEMPVHKALREVPGILTYSTAQYEGVAVLDVLDTALTYNLINVD